MANLRVIPKTWVKEALQKNIIRPGSIENGIPVAYCGEYFFYMNRYNPTKSVEKMTNLVHDALKSLNEAEYVYYYNYLKGALGK